MIKISHWQINPDDRSVKNTQSGKTHKIDPKTMAVLLLLIEQAGKVVSRDEFMQSVWSTSVTVEESLTRCISELRKVFDDHPKNPKFIKTIHGKGYQLLVEVTSTDAQVSKPRTFNSDKKQHAYIIYACLIALALSAAWVYSTWTPIQTEAAPQVPIASNDSSADKQKLKDQLLSVTNFPSRLYIDENNKNSRLEIYIDRVNESTADDEIVNIQIKNDDGLLVWQGLRRFDTQAQKVITAEDLGDILTKINAAKPAPEIEKLSKDLQTQYNHALYLIDRRGEDNLNKAIEILETIVSQRSDFVMAFIQQAVAVRSLSLYETEVEKRNSFLIKYELLLKQANARAPEHPVAKAISYKFDVADANFVEYEQLLKSSVEYAPACVVCVRELAEFYMHLGYFDQASKLLEKHLEYFPLSVLMHSYLAIIYSHQGNVELVEYQAEIIEALGENRGFDAASIKVQVAMMKGDLPEYLALREELLQQHPVYLQHSQVIDALIANNIEEARALIKAMPFLDFNLALSAGLFEELLARINNNLNNGLIRDFKFIHGYLHSDSFLMREYTRNTLEFKNSEEVIALFKDVGLMSYWQENDKWPDYCRFIEYQNHQPSYCPQ
jgi:DNA-binding winged helix-turn-helix (wHTH) protein